MPARPDLAAAHLEGQVAAARFVKGAPRRVMAPLADLRRAPRRDAPLDTQALHGEEVMVYEEDGEGWAWVQLRRDHYVGYVPAADLGAPGPAPTHKVVALRTFIYPGPSIKLPPREALPFAAYVAIAGQQGDFAVLTDGGHIFARHLAPLDEVVPDPAGTAERFLGAPYLWGGKSALGLDCSGLVQLAFQSAGYECPRDTSMQVKECGTAMPPETLESGLRRGDLVFWRGHVGMMLDATRLIHANAFHMAVAVEPLAEAIARIEGSGGGAVTGLRRISA